MIMITIMTMMMLTKWQQKNLTTNTLAGLTTWTVSLGIAEQSARPELTEDTSLANPISITKLGKS